MKYISQLDYEGTPYPTDVKNPDSPMRDGSIKMAGCGLCSLCMVVDRLTCESLPLLDCRDLAIEHKANLDPGTDLKVLSPVIAQKYGLQYECTDDTKAMVRWVQNGGCAIANVGGDRDEGKYIGVFSHGGHYITVISADEKELCILDPSLKEGKFDETGRQGKVRVVGNFAYCAPEVLAQDTDNRSPGYYLFAR
ncbi:MAG: hypothetical protein PHE47_00915 [Oscillospiraceae bacterium]|nr:hypothetical protein [Oscillospiraceae bacterium]